MAAYASVNDVEKRMSQDLSDSDKAVCETLLEDAAVIIDSFNENASSDAKMIVSCRMVIRALGADIGIPIGATQGSMSGLGYSQSWGLSGSGGSVGELYLAKLEKQLLGYGNKIGSKSPVEDITYKGCPEVWM